MFLTPQKRRLYNDNSMQSFVDDLLTTISNISSRLSGNSEEKVSESLDNLEDMFLQYYMRPSRND